MIRIVLHGRGRLLCGGGGVGCEIGGLPAGRFGWKLAHDDVGDPCWSCQFGLPCCARVVVSSDRSVPDEFAPDSRGLHCDPIQPRRTSIPQECAGAELLAGLACFAPIALTPAALVS